MKWIMGYSTIAGLFPFPIVQGGFHYFFFRMSHSLKELPLVCLHLVVPPCLNIITVTLLARTHAHTHQATGPVIKARTNFPLLLPLPGICTVCHQQD